MNSVLATARAPGRRPKPSAQAGFTLIEVLAAFVILSIGLLGIVSLQAVSKASQHQSVQRARAVSLGDEILERIRINPAGLATYVTGLGSPLGGGSLGVEPSPNCTTATCSATQLASHDLWLWEQALDGASATVIEGGVISSTGGLIDPRGCITFTADPGMTNTGIVDIYVQWHGLSESTDAVDASDGSACGGEDAGDEEARRQVVVSSYVLDGAELWYR